MRDSKFADLGAVGVLTDFFTVGDADKVEGPIVEKWTLDSAAAGIDPDT